jgi:hypothetical protein
MGVEKPVLTAEASAGVVALLAGTGLPGRAARPYRTDFQAAFRRESPDERDVGF